MGVSTDAMLVYGYVWEDEFELFDTAVCYDTPSRFLPLPPMPPKGERS